MILRLSQRAASPLPCGNHGRLTLVRGRPYLRVVEELLLTELREVSDAELEGGGLGGFEEGGCGHVGR